jgi:DnaJ-class molecular chaperone
MEPDMTLPRDYDAWRLAGPDERPDPKLVTCPDCAGQGELWHCGALVECEDCAGSGEVMIGAEEPDGDYLYERRRDAGMED